MKRNFSLTEKNNGEWAKNHMTGKAAELVENTPDLDFYEIQTDDGNRYYVRGVFDFDDLTLEDLQKELSELQTELEKC